MAGLLNFFFFLNLSLIRIKEVEAIFVGRSENLVKHKQAKVKTVGKCIGNYLFNFFLLFGHRLSEKVL